MTPNLCPKCSATLAPADTVCPQCGTTPSIAVPSATVDWINGLSQATQSLGDLNAAVPAVTLIPPVSSGDTLPFRIGRYDIREKIGEGSFGIVYRAWDPHLKRDVALKVAKPAQLSTPERKQRFLREAQSAAKLRHSNIVEVFEAGEDGAYSLIAQWFINGPSLDRMLDEQPDR